MDNKKILCSFFNERRIFNDAFSASFWCGRSCWNDRERYVSYWRPWRRWQKRAWLQTRNPPCLIRQVSDTAPKTEVESRKRRCTTGGSGHRWSIRVTRWTGGAWFWHRASKGHAKDHADSKVQTSNRDLVKAKGCRRRCRQQLEANPSAALRPNTQRSRLERRYWLYHVHFQKAWKKTSCAGPSLSGSSDIRRWPCQESRRYRNTSGPSNHFLVGDVLVDLLRRTV